MRVPSSTPAGIFTDSVRSRVMRPWPPQLPQGSEITWPLPWQVGQVRSTVKKPCEALTAPAPPQVPQVLGAVPGLAPVPLQTSQAVAVGTRIFMLVLVMSPGSNSLISSVFPAWAASTCAR